MSNASKFDEPVAGVTPVGISVADVLADVAKRAVPASLVDRDGSGD
jgi:hypothetical protein